MLKKAETILVRDNRRFQDVIKSVIVTDEILKLIKEGELTHISISDMATRMTSQKIAGKSVDLIVTDDPLDTHIHPTAVGPTGPPIYDGKSHTHGMLPEGTTGPDLPDRVIVHSGVRAEVVVTVEYVHVVIFSDEGEEQERYDIQRMQQAESLDLGATRSMSLEKMRDWMRRGCLSEES